MTAPGPALHLIGIEDTGETYACAPEQNLLRAMERVGRRGIPVGCRGGGCGVCKVRVLSGHYHARRMSRAQVSETEQAAGIGLACRLYPRSDMRVQVLGVLRRQVLRHARTPGA